MVMRLEAVSPRVIEVEDRRDPGSRKRIGREHNDREGGSGGWSDVGSDRGEDAVVDEESLFKQQSPDISTEVSPLYREKRMRPPRQKSMIVREGEGVKEQKLVAWDQPTRASNETVVI
ncbi:hypothetical protein B296_00040563 [Ensete ventricosum]|uniref:Uncharacterized protein n=1 Tax=Ensete ventricosum TaxID=4639 RepID=A0A426XWM9_ENSVE|nr:hypothetical protein B296_00040563 [Ensete ventricosum]